MDPIGKGDIEQVINSARVNRSPLPVCYVVNVAESIDDLPNKNDFSFDLSKASASNRLKYEHIGDILSSATEGFDIFVQYNARRIVQSFLAGVEPRYAHQGLFTRLKLATIELARAKKFDLLYSKATSQFSTRANLKLGYHKARIIDYNTYEDAQGRRVFASMSKTHQACTLTIKDLRD